MIITKSEELICLDAKMNFDDNAIFRRPEILKLRDLNEENPSEIEASKHDLKNFCVIHDCYGSPASELQRFIECVKQSFFNIYSDNNLDNLYHQSVQQLSDSKSLPTALRMGSFDITDVLTAPYIFT